MSWIESPQRARVGTMRGGASRDGDGQSGQTAVRVLALSRGRSAGPRRLGSSPDPGHGASSSTATDLRWIPAQTQTQWLHRPLASRQNWHVQAVADETGNPKIPKGDTLAGSHAAREISQGTNRLSSHCSLPRRTPPRENKKAERIIHFCFGVEGRICFRRTRCGIGICSVHLIRSVQRCISLSFSSWPYLSLTPAYLHYYLGTKTTRPQAQAPSFHTPSPHPACRASCRCRVTCSCDFPGACPGQYNNKLIFAKEKSPSKYRSCLAFSKVQSQNAFRCMLLP
ncbi:hypothetical protein B0H67DRAFT_179801 [Lasiosphaeris hirsuta]|uniref:Uncharacterized protein n=1 Tax=Lasiosphaeris hirsuta TaxID=260670 RepID=A0AA40AQN5_9PEZI|nr:hypothetical protein B0H67DRAFT_179801 [Lasiosphaeris hirsuta]